MKVGDLKCFVLIQYVNKTVTHSNMNTSTEGLPKHLSNKNEGVKTTKSQQKSDGYQS